MKLYTAVVKEIKELKKFSAYDITNSLRSKVSNTSLVIEDIDEFITNEVGDDVTSISHSDVNDIVKDIFDTQILPLKREQGQGYYIYQLDEGTSTPKVVNIKSSQSKQFLQGLINVGEINKKIKNYIEGKKKKNSIITIRGIHSSLKQKGLRVKEIPKICLGLGYTVAHKKPTYTSEIV